MAFLAGAYRSSQRGRSRRLGSSRVVMGGAMVFVSYKLMGGRGVIFWFSDKLREMECWVVVRFILYEYVLLFSVVFLSLGLYYTAT